MHKARIRANNYLWSRLSRERGIGLTKTRSLPKNLFILLADDSVAFCNYTASESESLTLNDDNMKKAADFCLNNFFNPVIVHSNNAIMSDKAQEAFAGLPYINIYPQSNMSVMQNENDITYHDSKSIMHATSLGNCCVLAVGQEELLDLGIYCHKALAHFKRVNINLIYDPQTLDAESYNNQLYIIARHLLEYFNNNELRQVNILTDDLFIKKRSNCNFGLDNFVLAPNGFVYACPAFYYDNPNNHLGSIDKDLDYNHLISLSLIHNSVCHNCNIKHCKFCIKWNENLTGEYHVPSSKQCKISQLENDVSYYLQSELHDNSKIKMYMNKIEKNKNEDPILSKSMPIKPMLNFSYRREELIKTEDTK